jgi:hypothetical protein
MDRPYSYPAPISFTSLLTLHKNAKVKNKNKIIGELLISLCELDSYLYTCWGEKQADHKSNNQRVFALGGV